jgi:hypothetical protein
MLASQESKKQEAEGGLRRSASRVRSHTNDRRTDRALRLSDSPFPFAKVANQRALRTKEMRVVTSQDIVVESENFAKEEYDYDIFIRGTA